MTNSSGQSDLVMQSGRGGLQWLPIETGLCSAAVCLEGGHITEFQPKSALHPILWMSERSFFASGKPIRGGIPICFPWFGPHRTDSTQPNHGYARIQPWRLVGAGLDSKEKVTVQLDTVIEPFHLEYRLELGSDLHAHLTVESRASTTCSFEIALHSYFAVSDIQSVCIEGLESSRYIDQLAEPSAHPVWLPPTGRSIRFHDELDRIYESPSPCCKVVHSGWQRRIEIHTIGCDSAVVWNPWIAKSRRMPDFGDEEWRQMVCVESANIGQNAVTLSPGESHSMELRILAKYET